MIVPRFKLTQTPETVTIVITAKYIKLNDLEFEVDDEKVLFFCNPYHLKLCLPGSLESEILHSEYNTDEGVLIFVMKKSNPGEHFKNLDMIIRLLSPVNEKKKLDRVLVLDDEENVYWDDTSETSYKYGFAMKGLYDFHRVIDAYQGVLKIDPRQIDVIERYNLQRNEENLKFSIDHYEADYGEEDMEIKDLIKLKSPWADIQKNELTFTNAELDILKDLPNRNYNLTQEERNYIYTSLIDILFAYCYDCRVTAFEGNSESGWTIAEIAGSLTWLTGFPDAKKAVLSAFRRSLIFPLYRNFNMSTQVFEDLKTVLKLGEICIMKCLLHIHNLFIEGDCCRYILNDIFIRDYIIYVGKWNSDEWNTVVEEIVGMRVEKKDLDLNLEEIEKNFLRRVLKIDEIDSDDEPNEGESETLPTDLMKKFTEKLENIEMKMEEKREQNEAATVFEKFKMLAVDLNDDPEPESQNEEEDDQNDSYFRLPLRTLIR